LVIEYQGSFRPVPEWYVCAHLEYDVSGENSIGVKFVFDIGKDYPEFEAFIASYFWGKRIPYIWTSHDLVRPSIANGQQRFFPRDDAAAKQVDDGRWGFLKNVGLFAENDGRNYRYPAILHYDDDDHWGLLQLVEPNECAAVSINTFAYAQDFSLMGRDVKQGDQIVVRARVIWAEMGTPEASEEIIANTLKEWE
jgi:hypothetical protein